jgi:hypothetical protein
VRRPVIHISDILVWADAYHEHWGRWPDRESGPVAGQLDMTWCGVDQALKKGHRGLRRGSSLARLLDEYRGVPNRMGLPHLSVEQIPRWADAHRDRTGRWPSHGSGPVHEAPGERWSQINRALAHGNRGLPGGSSLARLLAESRGVRPLKFLPPLTVEEILAWADSHRQRCGEWPTRYSGAIPEAPGESWEAVAEALYNGRRGMARDTLARLLARHRGRRNRKATPTLRVADILVWADRYRARTGQWPMPTCGAIPEAPGETWAAVHGALCRGTRGLTGRSSLYQLLREHRGVDRSARAACRAQAVEAR